MSGRAENGVNETKHGMPAAGSASPPLEPAADDVGRKLKSIRERFGLSQRELARKSGLTNGSISLIEQGQVSPSVASLRKIAESLSLSLAEFFGLDVDKLQQRTFFESASELKEIGTGGVSLRLVGASRDDRALQVLHERYAPGSDTGPELLSHPGEESGVVTCGRIHITVGNEERELGPGDAYYFDSRIPHRFRNRGKDPCEVISAATPPTF